MKEEKWIEPQTVEAVHTHTHTHTSRFIKNKESRNAFISHISYRQIKLKYSV